MSDIQPGAIKISLNVTDEFKKMVTDKVGNAKTEIENDIKTRTAEYLADIVNELKHMNSLLVIIASRPFPEGNAVAQAVNRNLVKSVALDGTVREAELPLAQWDGKPLT